jgi:hypothetical protein
MAPLVPHGWQRWQCTRIEGHPPFFCMPFIYCAPKFYRAEQVYCHIGMLDRIRPCDLAMVLFFVARMPSIFARILCIFAAWIMLIADLRSPKPLSVTCEVRSRFPHVLSGEPFPYTALPLDAHHSKGAGVLCNRFLGFGFSS